MESITTNHEDNDTSNEKEDNNGKNYGSHHHHSRGEVKKTDGIIQRGPQVYQVEEDEEMKVVNETPSKHETTL